MSAYDYLREWFDDDRVMACLAYYASIGTFAGPKSPGSAYVIMHHIMGEHEGAGGWGFIRGGMGAITQALAAAGREMGVEIFTKTSVAEIRVTAGRASEVVTKTGDVFRARVIASGANAKAVYLDMLRLPDLLDGLQDEHRLRASAAIPHSRQGESRWLLGRFSLPYLLPHRA
jgi:phytoene dehydrogenase-like protein